jgi:hypothetical protein
MVPLKSATEVKISRHLGTTRSDAESENSTYHGGCRIVNVQKCYVTYVDRVLIKNPSFYVDNFGIDKDYC